MRVIVVMGVAGAGKSTVGRALASALDWRFLDADDFHTAASVARMRSGIALTDDDRTPWLAALRHEITNVLARGERAVLACSALKESYRAALVAPSEHDAVRFVHLEAPTPILHERLERREGHYAGVALLESQLATLEEPSDALRIDGARAPDDIVATIRGTLQL